MTTPDHSVLQKILTLDIGTLNTRAALFTARPGGYELLGTGSAPTSLGEPFFNLRQGVIAAIEELQAVTGTELLDGQKNLVKPANANGLGVDGCAMVVSAGRPLNVVTMGLSAQASLESAFRLARMVPSCSVENIGVR